MENLEKVKKPTHREFYAELATFKNPVTLTDFIKGNEYASQFSTQKIRALFKKPLADGIVVNTVDKKKSLFSVAE